MTKSDIYVLKGHIETERQKNFRKLRDILRDTCLLGALGISRVAKFSPGEIIPCEIVPGRNPPPPCIKLELLRSLDKGGGLTPHANGPPTSASVALSPSLSHL